MKLLAAVIAALVLASEAKSKHKKTSKKPNKAFQFGTLPTGWTGSAGFKVAGKTGVAAMQLAVVTNDRVILYDRVENNPLRNGGNPFWSAEIDTSKNTVRGLPLITNSFCAGGAWLGNGSLVTIGGDPYTGYGAQNGYQGIRVFNPCENKKCVAFENPGKFYPPKAGGSIYSPFMTATEPWNLFPHAIPLPSDRVFVASDNGAMIFDWRNNKEYRLPNIPNNVRVNYPRGAAGALLPLTPANNYQPTVLLCGGTAISPGQASSVQTKASNQCASITLTSTGSVGGWQVSDPMPEARIMGNFVITPDGKLVLVNGAGTGAAGYFNNVQGSAGYSAADHPVQTPYLYDPAAPAGSRWISLGTKSNIARMYHSVASLMANGKIIIAGSNPNPTALPNQKPYPTEYRFEYLTLPYSSGAAPTFSNWPSYISYGNQYSMSMTLPGSDASQVSLVIMDLGYSTHGVQYNQRQVQLQASISGNKITFSGPPNAPIYPPGPAWMYLVYAGKPSMGQKIMVGN